MRVPSWMVAQKIASTSMSVDDRKLYELTIIDGHCSGVIRFRHTGLASSYVEALTLALEAWVPKTGEFESGGVSIQIGAGWVQSGGYRNDQGQVALMERPNEAGKQSLVFTEFDGTVTTFYSDAKAWTYLQDHHYQPVR